MRPVYGCPEKFWESSLCTRLLFQKFVMTFVPIDTKNVRTKVEVRSFTRSWDNRGYSKNWAVPGYAHAPFSPKILNGFCSVDPMNIPAKFEVRSFIRFWDNRGYSKHLGSPCIRPRSIFSQKFNWLLFAWTLWIYLPNLAFVALPIPEIIGGTQKMWTVPGYAHAPFSPKILKDFCSHGPS